MTEPNESETCNVGLAIEASPENTLETLVPLNVFSAQNPGIQCTPQTQYPSKTTTQHPNQLQQSIATEQGFTILDGVMYNRAGYEICGVKNQHNRPCQRIGFCPFHGKKKQDKQQNQQQNQQQNIQQPQVTQQPPPQNQQIPQQQISQQPIQTNVEKKKPEKSLLKKQPFKQGWTKEEHLRFLTGLQIHGKGAWKDIAAIVSTRTATQIQSHAQKYFLRQRQKVKNKRSIHDFTIEDLQKAVAAEAAARQRQQQQQQNATVMATLDPTVQFANIQDWKKCAELLQVLQQQQQQQQQQQAMDQTLIPQQLKISPFNQQFLNDLNLDPMSQWRPLMNNPFSMLDNGMVPPYPPSNHQRIEPAVTQQPSLVNSIPAGVTQTNGNAQKQQATTQQPSTNTTTPSVVGQKRKLDQTQSSNQEGMNEPVFKKNFTSTLYRE